MSDAEFGVNPLSVNLCEMKVEINHHEVAVEGDCKTLLQILELENLDGRGIAVAVDNCVVPRDRWAITELVDGMKITVIRAVCGG